MEYTFPRVTTRARQRNFALLYARSSMYLSLVNHSRANRSRRFFIRWLINSIVGIRLLGTGFWVFSLVESESKPKIIDSTLYSLINQKFELKFDDSSFEILSSLEFVYSEQVFGCLMFSLV